MVSAFDVASDPSGRAQVLDRDTCLQLLRSVAIGRIAWAAEGGRVVMLPVNFVLDGNAVVFRTAEGGKLKAIREGHPLAFEADDVERAMHVGWSVLIAGVAEEVTAPDETHRLAELPLAPWDPAPKPVFVRLPIQEMTGRRLSLRPGRITVIRQDETPD